MAKKINNNSSILIGIISAVLLAFIHVVINIFNGVSDKYSIIAGVLFFILLAYCYYRLVKHYKNILVFFSFLFLALWMMPTIQYYQYLKNDKNYTGTEDFYKSGVNLASELSEGKLSFKELTKIVEELKKKKQTNTIYTFQNVSILNIPDTVFFSSEFKYGIGGTGTFEIKLRKNDSIKTLLIVQTEGPRPSDNEILEKIEREKERQFELENIRNGQSKIFYSEFLIEAITCFSSGDIKPSRNFPKLLNGIEGLLIIFLTTILINTVGTGLSIEKRTKKKKNKKR